MSDATIKMKLKFSQKELTKILQNTNSAKLFTKITEKGKIKAADETASTQMIEKFVQSSWKTKLQRSRIYKNFMKHTPYLKQSPALEDDGFNDDIESGTFITEAVEKFFIVCHKRGLQTCYYQGLFGPKELSKYNTPDRELFRMSEVYCPAHYAFFKEDVFSQACLEAQVKRLYKIAFNEYYLNGKISDQTKLSLWKWFWVARFNRVFNENSIIDNIKDDLLLWYESVQGDANVTNYILVNEEMIDTFNFGKFKLHDPRDFPLEVLFKSHEDHVWFEKSEPRLYPLYNEDLLATLEYKYGFIKYWHRSKSFGFIEIPPEYNTLGSKPDVFCHKDDFIQKVTQKELPLFAKKHTFVKFKMLDYKNKVGVQAKAVRVELLSSDEKKMRRAFIKQQKQTKFQKRNQ